MGRVEFADDERDAERVWRKAPRRFVLKENLRRRNEQLPELRCTGISDDECSVRQLAWLDEARTVDRIRLANAEALLSDVRAELAARSKK